jgi:serine/threonine protein kinase
MGEVYRATDTRLDRTVAVKVLSRVMHQREDVRQRFEREARAISKLNHPHICTLHDMGQQDGIDYLVMECLEGETVEARLKRSPLPLPDVLRYGIQIANGLDRAHRSGIVHRDLKPSNIMLTKDGAKLLDFGLAKSEVAPAPGDQTVTQTLTNEGTILGTLPYMAPEQLEGKQADTRTDIFAFGSVLFEMLTRRKAFAGNSQASLIAAIMSADPAPFRDLDFPMAPALERIVRTCLAKDPEDRWQSARDIALELKFVAESPPSSPQHGKQLTPGIWPWLAGLLFAGILALAAWSLYHHRQQSTAALVQFEITAPVKSEFSGFGSALSPDGRYVAFVAVTEGKERLWVRPLDERNARVLEDTDGAQFPFWSPDSGSIGFFTHNQLKRIDLNGVSRTIVTTANGRCGTWSREGVIVYSPRLSSPLWKVAATGGDPVPATILDIGRGDARHNFPQFLPDGRHFLFFARGTDPQRSGPHIGSLDDPARTEAIPQLQGNAFQAIYAPSKDVREGHLLYIRDRSLVAQPFNTRTLRLEGEPELILSRDAFSVASSPGFLNLTASSTGTLLDGGSQRVQNELVWRKRDGTPIEAVGEEGDYITPRISPDASRMAVTKADSISGNYDIWINDFKQKLFSRLTFQRGFNYYPVWTPDGRSIIYTSDSAGRPSLFRKTVTGTGESERLLKNPEGNEYGYDISADGKFLLFAQIRETDRGDLWVLPLYKNAEPFPYLKTPAGELHPQFSPGAQGGKWVVYTSDESGIDQVYVRRFTGGTAAEAKWQISSNGGRFPRWRGNGSDIVYLAPDGRFMSAAIRCTSDSVEAGTPRVLFDAALPSLVFSRYPYDLSPDGQRFLVVNAARGHLPGSLTVILNWTGILKP